MFVKWQVVCAAFLYSIVFGPAMVHYMDCAFRYIPDGMKPTLRRRLMQLWAGVMLALWVLAVVFWVEYFVHEVLQIPEIPAVVD